jgi:hypothetical protein
MLVFLLSLIFFLLQNWRTGGQNRSCGEGGKRRGYQCEGEGGEKGDRRYLNIIAKSSICTGKLYADYQVLENSTCAWTFFKLNCHIFSCIPFYKNIQQIFKCEKIIFYHKKNHLLFS